MVQPPSSHWRVMGFSSRNSQLNHLALLVQLKGRLSHPLGQFLKKPFPEPVGGSAPKFSAEMSGLNLDRSSDQPFSFTCPAQGSPVPAFRSVTYGINFSRASRWISSQISCGSVKLDYQKKLGHAFQPHLCSPGVACPSI